ncbi:hypothetical protein FRC03_000746 [Tulasnella sp. 419]|nr:hypothetical protein FRC02_000863 [Tulasnella sp. 418]KAG8965281.1 hypothetical protein FRC03_000746 [Tulasnella sp. 419]
MDLSSLEPHIRRILTAPDVDLATISAKRVRKQLIAEGEDEEKLRQCKDEVDALIAQVFHLVNEAAQVHTGGEASPGPKRKRSSSPGDDQSSQAVHSDSRQKPGHLKSDEQLARQLSHELNGRATRGSSTSGTAKGKGSRDHSRTKTKKPRGKSSPTIDSEQEDEGEDDGPSRKKAKGGFGKEYMLSDALANLVGAPVLSRPQAVKKIWDHIKENNLQDPNDKREILCDSKLKAIFRTDRLNMFKMNKMLGQHLIEPGE